MNKDLQPIFDELKTLMIEKTNQIKFATNFGVELKKAEHTNHICEAFCRSSKTWLAALIVGLDEKYQKVEIAWVGA